MAVRIAVQIQPQHADYVAIERAVAEAEDIGVDVILNWDHFFPLTGDPDGKHFECWTMLGAWAQQTSRAEIGALVTCNSYRNPDLLGDMARTVDHISDGRLILGIGSGWKERDYDEFGYPFGTAGSRLDDLAEALPRIRRRMAVGNPPPTRDVPIMIGGGGVRKTLPLVAQYATIWHSFADLDEFVTKSALLDDLCNQAGRDPSEIERSTAAPGNGRPEDAEALVDAGAGMLTIGVSGPDYDLSAVRDWVRWRDARG